MPILDPKPGELVLYRNGDSFELGLVKSICPADGKPFVYYSGGETASKTPLENLYRLKNGYAVTETILGGRELRLKDGTALPPGGPK